MILKPTRSHVCLVLAALICSSCSSAPPAGPPTAEALVGTWKHVATYPYQEADDQGTAVDEGTVEDTQTKTFGRDGSFVEKIIRVKTSKDKTKATRATDYETRGTYTAQGSLLTLRINGSRSTRSVFTSDAEGWRNQVYQITEPALLNAGKLYGTHILQGPAKILGLEGQWSSLSFNQSGPGAGTYSKDQWTFNPNQTVKVETLIGESESSLAAEDPYTLMLYSIDKDGLVSLTDSTGRVRYYGRVFDSWFVFDDKPDLGAFAR